MVTLRAPLAFMRTMAKFRWSPLYLSAGMRRSGSTLLFNILRELLTIKYGAGLTSGWIDDLKHLPTGTAYLIKTHHLDSLRFRASAIFYTFRDIRVALVSDARRFDERPSLARVDEWIGQYTLAKRHATLCLKYEDLVTAPVEAVSSIAGALAIDAEPEAIWALASDLESPAAGSYSKTTLLHPQHRTMTDDHDWREVLDPALIRQMNEKYHWWFRECGYSAE